MVAVKSGSLGENSWRIQCWFSINGAENWWACARRYVAWRRMARRVLRVVNMNWRNLK